MKFFPSVALAVLVATSTASAILNKDSTTNTAPPPNGAPWANMGAINGAGGVYLGNGWVLTPGHVFNASAPEGKSITFDIGTFQADGEFVFLKNPDDQTNADMVLFRLTIAPPLPALVISSATPLISSEVTMIGFGRIRGSDEKSYGTARGFDWSVDSAKSWGENRVSSAGDKLNNTFVFSTNFSRSGLPSLNYDSAVRNEAQATLGDSGAGVFVQRNGIWELAGSMDTIGQASVPERGFVNGLAPNAVYGDRSNAADLSVYRDQIRAVVVPEPGSMVLMASAVGAWGFLGRRRKSS
jgi:hypothetical protein